jgi:hypothetical protein
MSTFVQNKVAVRVDIRSLEKLALETYRECPRFVTIITHADLTDDSGFHCVPSAPFVGPKPVNNFSYQRDFIVPGQEITLLQDDTYGLFTLLKVLDTQDGPAYWMLSSVASRMGFIIAYDELPIFLYVETQLRSELVEATA